MKNGPRDSGVTDLTSEAFWTLKSSSVDEHDRSSWSSLSPSLDALSLNSLVCRHSHGIAGRS